MKNLFLNQFTVVYFLLVVITYFLILRGRQDFIVKKKVGFLVLAVVSTLVSTGCLIYFSLITYWWMLICLFNLSILVIIIVDNFITQFLRSLVGVPKQNFF